MKNLEAISLHIYIRKTPKLCSYYWISSNCREHFPVCEKQNLVRLLVLFLPQAAISYQWKWQHLIWCKQISSLCTYLSYRYFIHKYFIIEKYHLYVVFWCIFTQKESTNKCKTTTFYILHFIFNITNCWDFHIFHFADIENESLHLFLVSLFKKHKNFSTWTKL